MTPEELAQGMKELFIDEAIESYQLLYTNAEISNDTDTYSMDIKSVMSSLDENGKRALFKLIKIVCMDSTISFCSFLDGECGFENQTDQLKLTSENSQNLPLNGSLVMHLDRILGNY